MELDVSFMSSILSLGDELVTNGISVVYIGKFTHQVTMLFSAMYEEEMKKNEEDKKTKRRVYHSMVEILQNMQKHSSQMIQDYNMGSGLFMIGKREDVYYIITSNRIARDAVPKLKSTIESVNVCTRDELREMYKKQLKDGSISAKGGAGLGFIDLARKTGEKLDYLFIPVDNDTDYFVLKIEINTSKMSYDENGD